MRPLEVQQDRAVRPLGILRKAHRVLDSSQGSKPVLASPVLQASLAFRVRVSKAPIRVNSPP